MEAATDDFEIVSYIARTSLASIGMGAIEDREIRSKVEALASPFQKRMLMNDLDKTTASLIADTPHDMLLLDFVDERFNLVLSGQTLFSFSGELEKSGLDVTGRQLVAPESGTFLALWTAGLDRLFSSIDLSKVVLNRVLWAERFPDGTDVSSMGWIKRSNAHLLRLYETVDKYWKVRCINYPAELIVADPKHRWGIAPYHYVDVLYQHAINELRKIAH